MRISSDELRQFRRAALDAPPPIEPRLTAAEEAEVIAGAQAGDRVAEARRQRVLALVRRPAVLEGADAELVALLAAASALPLERDEDRTHARLRLVEIGRLREPPPEVARLLRRLGIEPGDSHAFADALLPPLRDIRAFHESGKGFVLPPPAC